MEGCWRYKIFSQHMDHKVRYLSGTAVGGSELDFAHHCYVGLCEFAVQAYTHVRQIPEAVRLRLKADGIATVAARLQERNTQAVG
jgi:hypothetical protein